MGSKGLKSTVKLKYIFILQMKSMFDSFTNVIKILHIDCDITVCNTFIDFESANKQLLPTKSYFVFNQSQKHQECQPIGLHSSCFCTSYVTTLK